MFDFRKIIIFSFLLLISSCNINASAFLDLFNRFDDLLTNERPILVGFEDPYNIRLTYGSIFITIVSIVTISKLKSYFNDPLKSKLKILVKDKCALQKIINNLKIKISRIKPKDSNLLIKLNLQLRHLEQNLTLMSNAIKVLESQIEDLRSLGKVEILQKQIDSIVASSNIKN